MKKRLLIILGFFIGVGLAFSLSVGAQMYIPSVWERSDDDTYVIPIDNDAGTTLNVGATGDRIPYGYFTDLSATNLTITATTTSPLLLDDGTVSAPAYSFMNDSNSGLYRIGADNIGLTLNGSNVVDYATTGVTITGDLTVSGTSSSSLFYAGDGTASLPSYSFASDTDTGIFRLSANELSFGAGGSEGLRIDFNELEVQPLMTLATGPIELEEDAGAVTAINLPVSATPTAGDEMSITFSIDSNSVLTVKALADSSGGVDNLIVYTPDGVNFGIGTSTPATLLDIYSSATSTITIDSDSATQGACLKLSDFDSSDYTYCVVQDGTMSCSVNSCE